MELSGILAYLVSLAIMAGIYAVFCLGLNIQWGYTGLFNIGIAGFFCIGAYTSAMITTPSPTGVYAQYVHQLFGEDIPAPVRRFARQERSEAAALHGDRRLEST